MVATREREPKPAISEQVRSRGSARAFRHQPVAALRTHVERIWGWAEPQALRLPVVAPGLGAELFFHHGEPFRAVIRGAEQQLERAHLLCVRASPLALLDLTSAGFTAVRIHAGALGRFTPIPLRELRDTQLSIGEIWGRAGTELANRVAEAKNTELRVRLIERFLLRRLAEPAGDPLMERALRIIYRRSHAISVADLAKLCGLGRRQLERRISAYFGQTAVELRCLARFYHAARALAVDPVQDSLQGALAAGYYDQPHFIREFRRFAGMTPEAFKLALASATHFYNPSHAAVR